MRSRVGGRRSIGGLAASVAATLVVACSHGGATLPSRVTSSHVIGRTGQDRVVVASVAVHNTTSGNVTPHCDVRVYDRSGFLLNVGVARASGPLAPGRSGSYQARITLNSSQKAPSTVLSECSG